jgi:hypothetical protein
MRGVINLLAHFATLRDRAVTILVATTGEACLFIACDYHRLDSTHGSFLGILHLKQGTLAQPPSMPLVT